MNSLGIDLTGKYVVLFQELFTDSHTDLRFRIAKVMGGFGCRAVTTGSALFVEFAGGERDRFDGGDVERLATEQELEELYG